MYNIKKPSWTPEAIIKAFQDFYARTGRWPLTTDCGGVSGRMPNATVVWRFFGSIAAARKAAGMPDGAKIKKRGSGSKWDKAWLRTHRRIG